MKRRRQRRRHVSPGRRRRWWKLVQKHTQPAINAGFMDWATRPGVLASAIEVR